MLKNKDKQQTVLFDIFISISFFKSVNSLNIQQIVAINPVGQC